MNFRSKSLLITGGAGFIGSNFINYLFNKYNNIKVVNLDLLTYAGDLDNLKSVEDNSRYKFIQGNINDKNLVENIFNEYQIDGVINFAAESHVDNSITNPEIFINTNINGVFNLLNCAFNYWMDNPFKVKKKFRMARFHQISTDEVYGSILKGSFDEDSRYSPNSPYSASKASADMIVRSFHKTYGLNTTISVCSNNYGPNQNKEKLIPKIIDCLINNKSIPIFGDGMNVRNWIYVDDHCQAVDVLFNNAKSGSIYNIASKNELTNIEVVEIIYRILKKKNKVIKKIEFVKDRYGHDFRYSVSFTKIKEELGWSPFYNLTQGLKKYLDFL